MPKKAVSLTTPTDVRKACQQYWQETFETIRFYCTTVLKNHQKARDSLLQALKRRKADLTSLEKKVRSLAITQKEKSTKTLQKQYDNALHRLSETKKEMTVLKKQIVRHENQILQIKTIQKKQQAKISACRAFKSDSIKEKSSAKLALHQQSVLKNASHSLQVGDLAPEFNIMSDTEQTINLKVYRGQYVVLYFYPKDDTPGCTQQAETFTDYLDRFAAKNAVILGVSRDKVSSHQRFKVKYNLAITLLADTGEVVCQRYGVIKQKTMFGKPVRGIERSTFLIDPNGKIKQIWRGVKVPGHVETILEAIQST